jgi:hypothetical protein
MPARTWPNSVGVVYCCEMLARAKNSRLEHDHVLETFRIHSRTRCLDAESLLVEQLDSSTTTRMEMEKACKSLKDGFRQVPLRETQHGDDKTGDDAPLLICPSSRALGRQASSVLTYSVLGYCSGRYIIRDAYQCVCGKMSRSAAEVSPGALEFWSGRLSTFKQPTF